MYMQLRMPRHFMKYFSIVEIVVGGFAATCVGEGTELASPYPLDGRYHRQGVLLLLLDEAQSRSRITS
jgi:hypothetical protein